MCRDWVSPEDCNYVQDTSEVNEGIAPVSITNYFGLVLLGCLNWFAFYEFFCSTKLSVSPSCHDMFLIFWIEIWNNCFGSIHKNGCKNEPNWHCLIRSLLLREILFHWFCSWLLACCYTETASPLAVPSIIRTRSGWWLRFPDYLEVQWSQQGGGGWTPLASRPI